MFGRREKRIGPVRRLLRFVLRWVFRLVVVSAVLLGLWILAYKWVNPWATYHMWSESNRLGGVKYEWVDAEDVAPVLFRTVVAAEDADFCNHSGVDWSAIQQALSEGAQRGGSTISQQTVKNAFLWQGRSWIRKGLEVVITPVAEWVWGKDRLLELYVNIIEFDTGVFGIQAAAQHHFGRDASELNRVQAGRLAAVLPNPRKYQAVNPSNFIRDRASSIIAGSDMIRRDGRSGCFED